MPVWARNALAVSGNVCRKRQHISAAASAQGAAQWCCVSSRCCWPGCRVLVGGLTLLPMSHTACDVAPFYLREEYQVAEGSKQSCIH
jgi:hypothetical protein